MVLFTKLHPGPIANEYKIYIFDYFGTNMQFINFFRVIGWLPPGFESFTRN